MTFFGAAPQRGRPTQIRHSFFKIIRSPITKIRSKNFMKIGLVG